LQSDRPTELNPSSCPSTDKISTPPSAETPEKPGLPPLRLGRLVSVSAAMLVLQTAIILRTHLFFNLYLAASSLPQITIVLLLALCLLNRGLSRRMPGAALNGAELAIIFGVLLLTAAIPQSAVCENAVSVAVTPAYFSTPENHWQSLFFGQMPPWLRVTDPAAKGFYEGLQRGEGVPWNAWLLPLAAWGVFAGLFFAAMATLAALVYGTWAGSERLPFPLVLLPLEIIRAGEGSAEPLWYSRIFWLGAAIPILSITLAAVHGSQPTVPIAAGLEQYHGEIFSWPPDGTQIFTGQPWSALNGFRFSLWAIVVGISYFLQADIAVSIWAFHLLSWGERLALASLGVGTGGAGAGDPLVLIHWQEFGGCACLSLLLLANLVKTFRRDGWPVRTLAVFGGVNLGLLLWGKAAGADLAVMLGFLLIAYLIVVALARLIAAGGLFLVDSAFTPQNLLNSFAGTHAFTPPGQGVLGGMQTIYGRFDQNPAYFTLNALRAADVTGASPRLLGVLGAFSVVFVYVLSCAIILSSAYHHGGASRFSVYPLTGNALGQWNTVAYAVQNPTLPVKSAFSWAASGAALVGVLTLLQSRTGWPLSPVGLAVATSWNTTNQIWSSVLVGWLCSAAVRRWDGLKAYVSLKPFFLGLILGNMVAVVATSLIGMISGAYGAG